MLFSLVCTFSRREEGVEFVQRPNRDGPERARIATVMLLDRSRCAQLCHRSLEVGSDMRWKVRAGVEMISQNQTTHPWMSGGVFATGARDSRDTRSYGACAWLFVVTVIRTCVTILIKVPSRLSVQQGSVIVCGDSAC